MFALFYALLASGFSAIKYGLSKTTLIPYANDINLLNMIFIKHIIKTVFYLIFVYLLSKSNFKLISNELGKLLTETKKGFLGLKINKYFKLFLIICLVSIIEIVYSFPFYTGLKKFKLSTFVISTTILGIILNLTLGVAFFNETIYFTQFVGVILCIIGVTMMIK